MDNLEMENSSPSPVSKHMDSKKKSIKKKTNKNQKLKNKTFTNQKTSRVSQLCAQSYSKLTGSRFCISGNLMQPED